MGQNYGRMFDRVAPMNVDVTGRESRLVIHHRPFSIYFLACVNHRAGWVNLIGREKCCRRIELTQCLLEKINILNFTLSAEQCGLWHVYKRNAGGESSSKSHTVCKHLPSKYLLTTRGGSSHFNPRCSTRIRRLIFF